MKLALLIPTTSKNRPWKTWKETYLYNLTLRSYLNSYSTTYTNTPQPETEPLYTHVYIGYDVDDAVWGQARQRDQITRFLSVMKQITCTFVPMEGIPKGYLTKMWNRLYHSAYHDGCDYFFQCGDDIRFHTQGWVNESIRTLQLHHNLGLVGPINNNSRILTQGMVSRTHMDIFGFFFPEEIKNWCCDDWYNYVYHPNYLYVLRHHRCTNDGGEERYEIDRNPTFRLSMMENTRRLRQNTYRLAQLHRKQVDAFAVKHGLSSSSS